MDLVLRGGRVIDPSQGLDRVCDVGFSNGKVAAIGENLKSDASTVVRDVTGLIVAPGLIDLHTHVYWGGTSLGIDAEDFCRTSGVTTAVDTNARRFGSLPISMSRMPASTDFPTPSWLARARTSASWTRSPPPPLQMQIAT
jgi:predicted amidohydrolase YtcJ